MLELGPEKPEKPEKSGTEPEDGFERLELGRTQAEPVFAWHGECVALADLEAIYEEVLEDIYPTRCRKAPTHCREVAEGAGG